MTASTAPTFTGWPADASAFLAELAADNTREFWSAHAHQYAASVLPPMTALAAALEPEFGALRVFRPHRDRRFRPDAPPYRTDVGGSVASPGGTEFGVVLSGAALSVRIGHWLFDAGQLRRYRAAVVDEPGEELAGVLGALGGGLALGELPALASSPRGFSAEHPRIALLRLKALHVGTSWPVGPWLGTPEPLERVRTAWRAARPLAEWLDAHVGPPTPR